MSKSTEIAAQRTTEKEDDGEMEKKKGGFLLCATKCCRGRDGKHARWVPKGHVAVSWCIAGNKIQHTSEYINIYINIYIHIYIHIYIN